MTIKVAIHTLPTRATHLRRVFTLVKFFPDDIASETTPPHHRTTLARCVLPTYLLSSRLRTFDNLHYRYAVRATHHLLPCVRTGDRQLYETDIVRVRCL